MSAISELSAASVGRFRDAAPGDERAVQAVVSSVLREYGLSFDPAGTDADLDDLQASYLQRGGVFRVLVTQGGRLVGCGGLQPLSPGEAEIRKMYFLPEARGHGLGRTLLAELVAVARARGFERVVLETASVLKEATALYRSFGFVEAPRARLASRCDLAFAMDLGTEPRTGI